MRVEAQIFIHPKFMALEKLIGECALNKLARLWGHCEANQRGEFWAGKFGHYVETVAAWKGDPDVLYEALKTTGWIKRERHGTRISGWEENNCRTVSNWSLGRIPKTKTHKPRESLGLAKDEPRVSRLNERTNGTKEEEGGQFVKTGVVQFAALQAQIKRLEEARKAGEFSDDDRRLLKEKKAALLELQDKQAKGEKL